MTSLSYTIVIATRNRPKALTLSIPQMLNQSRLPERIIICDSSDDHNSTKKAVLQIPNIKNVPIEIKKCSRGLTLQRNEGLKEVLTPIVFFPDDDSIWYPHFSERILNAYEQDSKNEISAIGGIEAKTPPPGTIETTASYKKNNRDKLLANIMNLKRRFENKFIQDPFQNLGRQFISSSSNWTPPSDKIRLVEYVTGFRMSFRTEAIKAHLFDETLSEYGLNEDVDASFSAWKNGYVTANIEARVYHHKSPEARTNGYKLGATSCLNRAYVIAKHTDKNNSARNIFYRFHQYNKLICRIQSLNNQYFKDKFRGMKAAQDHAAKVLNSKTEADTAETYKAATTTLFR